MSTLSYRQLSADRTNWLVDLSMDDSARPDIAEQPLQTETAVEALTDSIPSTPILAFPR